MVRAKESVLRTAALHTLSSGKKGVLPIFHQPATTIAAVGQNRMFLHSILPIPLLDQQEYATCNETTMAISVLKIDLLGAVVGLSYLGDEQPEVWRLPKFVGWHETFLNDAVNSYTRGDVLDWVT